MAKNPKMFWLLHGSPDGFKMNASPADPRMYQEYITQFHGSQVCYAPKSLYKTPMPDGSMAYTVCIGNIRDVQNTPGSYVGLTVFLHNTRVADDKLFCECLINWLKLTIMQYFMTNKPVSGFRWNQEMSEDLFRGAYDARLGRELVTTIDTYLDGEEIKLAKRLELKQPVFPQDKAKILRQEIANIEAELRQKQAELTKIQQEKNNQRK